MKKIIILTAILCILCTSVYAEKIYELSLSNTGDALTYSSVKMGDGEPIIRTLDYPYKIEMKDSSDKQVNLYSFEPPFYGAFILNLPYDKSITKIIIKDNQGKEIFDIPTEEFADTCRDQICDPYESYETCPADCKSGGIDDYCDGKRDGICDPDCTAEDDIDCAEINLVEETVEVIEKKEEREIEENAIIQIKKKEDIIETPKKISGISPTAIILSILAFAVLIIIAIFVLSKTKAKKESNTALVDYFMQYMNQGYSYEQIAGVLRQEGYSEEDIMNAHDSALRKMIN